jgi:ubiquinol-cytochrome c reductase cytochrome b subunit
MNQVGGARRAIRGFFTPIEEPVDVELEQRAEAGPAPPRATRELTRVRVARPRAAVRGAARD